MHHFNWGAVTSSPFNIKQADVCHIAHLPPFYPCTPNYTPLHLSHPHIPSWPLDRNMPMYPKLHALSLHLPHPHIPSIPLQHPLLIPFRSTYPCTPKYTPPTSDTFLTLWAQQTICSTTKRACLQWYWWYPFREHKTNCPQTPPFSLVSLLPSLQTTSPLP